MPTNNTHIIVVVDDSGHPITVERLPPPRITPKLAPEQTKHLLNIPVAA